MPISAPQRQALAAYLAGLQAPDIFGSGMHPHMPHKQREVPEISQASQFAEANHSGRGPAHGWEGEGGAGLRHGTIASFRGYTCSIPLRILTMNENPAEPPTPYSAYLDSIAGTNSTIHLTVMGMAAPSFYGAGYIRRLHDYGMLRCVVSLVQGFDPWPVMQLPTLDYYHRPLRDFAAAGGGAPPLFPRVSEALPGPRTPYTAGYCALNPNFLRDMVALAVFAKNNTQRAAPPGVPFPCPPALVSTTPTPAQPHTTYAVRPGNPEIVNSVAHLMNADHRQQADPYGLLNAPLMTTIDEVKNTQVVNSPLELSAVIFHCAWGWGRTGTVISAFLLIDIMYHMSNAYPDILEFYYDECQNAPTHLRIAHVHLPTGPVPCTPLVSYVVNKQRQDVFASTGNRSRIIETAAQLDCLMMFEGLLLYNRHLFRDVSVGGAVNVGVPLAPAAPAAPAVPPAPAVLAGAGGPLMALLPRSSVNSSMISSSTVPGTPVAGGPQLPSMLPLLHVSPTAQTRSALRSVYYALYDAALSSGYAFMAGEQTVFNALRSYFEVTGNSLGHLTSAQVNALKDLCLLHLNADVMNPAIPAQRLTVLNTLLTELRACV